MTFLRGSVLVLVFIAQSAFGCRCLKPKSAQEGADRAEAVFSGRVLTLHKAKNNQRYNVKVDFEVLEPWKGVVATRLSVMTGGGDCAYPFKKGKRYLVYAFDKEELKTDVCTRTVDLEVAKPDVKFLKTKILKAPVLATTGGGKNLFWEFHKKDLPQILQMVLDDERLDRYFHIDSKPERKPLVVLENQFTKDHLKLTKFGEPVRILERKKTDLKTAVLDFSEITFDKDSALIRFVYTGERVRGEVGLQKAEQGWQITRYDLTEQ